MIRKLIPVALCLLLISVAASAASTKKGQSAPPAAKLSSSAFEYGLILHTTVTIGYDAPWRQVHELLVSAAQATENILELPHPFVLQTSLDDFYVSYEPNVYTENPSVMARTYSALHQNIQEKFNEAGV